jgi:hypothetical protein
LTPLDFGQKVQNKLKLETDRSLVLRLLFHPVGQEKRNFLGSPIREEKAKMLNLRSRKRVLLIAANILAARKLAQFEGGARVPATICAIADSIRWAEEIMAEIDRRWPTKVSNRGNENSGLGSGSAIPPRRV